jgi:hypothetical protein
MRTTISSNALSSWRYSHEQRVVISGDDYDFVKGTRSRLRPGTVLTRDELLMLALMSSENRAAASLARTYPGGTEAFVVAMNAKARALGHCEDDVVCGKSPGPCPDVHRARSADREASAADPQRIQVGKGSVEGVPSCHRRLRARPAG